jgi:hypothetical protein
MRTAVRLPLTRFSRMPHSLCLIVFHLTIANFVEYGVPLPNLYNYLHSVPVDLMLPLCVGTGAGVSRLFFRTLFPASAHLVFFGVHSKTEISAFETDSCVRLIGAVTRTASLDGVQFESLMLAKDVTGQTGPSPIPRFGDGNKSEEKECKLL